MPEYIYPPRPISSILPARLPRYSKRPWIGQRKFNGTRNVIRITSERDIFYFTRHGQPHKQWIPSRGRKGIEKQLLSLNLPEGVECWLDSEVMHNKSKDPHYKNRVVLFDLLFLGKSLFRGPTFAKRYEKLSEICGNPTELEPKHGLALQATKNIWLAENFSHDILIEEYKRFLHLDEIEGMVLKKSNSKIDNLGVKEYETSWLVRCRQPHKNYLL